MDYLKLEVVVIPVSDVDCAKFVSFSDPDGNTWFIQEITKRLPGR